MVTVLALLGVLGVLFAAAVLSTREEPLLAEAGPDAADLPLPQDPLQPEDVGRLRFSLAARGYRMSEVDLALERLAAELADRDRRIALLEAAAQGHEEPAAPAAELPVREATPADLPVAEVAIPAATPAATPAVPPPPTPPAGDPPAPAPARSSTWSSPSSVPEFPVIDAPERDADPLPAADLGSELVSQERLEQAGQQPDDRSS